MWVAPSPTSSGDEEWELVPPLASGEAPGLDVEGFIIKQVLEVMAWPWHLN